VILEKRKYRQIKNQTFFFKEQVSPPAV